MGKERAALVSVIQQYQSEELVTEYLDELAFLATTAGAIEAGRFTQKLQHPDPKTYVGKGKLAEIQEFCEVEKIDTVIFDDELSPSQLRNLERALKDIKILDRTNLILDIFAFRAKTAQAKAQVELAQNEYLLPRLTRMWTHLSRQKGGIGTKGPGEKEIETDRRIIQTRISLLKKQLEKIDKQNITQRKNRGEKIRVALVGYTNAGKSTIMNMLSKTDVLAENKLFATLDTTVRKVVVQNVPFLFFFTVGFIRKLPHKLVESFKSTLDEVREADILLHVVDLSNPQYEKHIEVVQRTLNEIGCANKTTLIVFNKIDQYEVEGYENIDDLLNYLESSLHFCKYGNSVFISAVKKINIKLLKKTLVSKVMDAYNKVYPYHTITVFDY